MKLGKFFHHLFVKAENGLDKLISAQDKLNTVLHDTEAALDNQVANSKKLFAAKAEFEDNLEKVRKDVSRFKTQCEVLKNRGLKPEDDELRIAAAQYLENKKVLDDLEAQKCEIDAHAVKVEKMLKRLKLNKSLITVKAKALETKISMYQVMENITDQGIVDINTMFDEVDREVTRMRYENEAARHVNDLVQGRETEQEFKNAEIDDFLNSL